MLISVENSEGFVVFDVYTESRLYDKNNEMQAPLLWVSAKLTLLMITKKASMEL
jgi:hypothetical protein